MRVSTRQRRTGLRSAAALYLLASLGVAVLWTWGAKSDRPGRTSTSVVAIANGTAETPFVRRRLLAEAAAGVAQALPQEGWRRIDGLIHRVPPAESFVQGVRWPREHYPILISATLLIWLTAFGFMWVSRAITNHVYATDPGMATVAGLCLGLGLLGGGGDGHYFWYPYDIPHTFLFGLGLLAVIADSRWFVPVTVAAAYSKETAVLLVVAYVLWHGRAAFRWLRTAEAGAALLACLAIQAWLRARFPGINPFWSPERSARWLLWELVYDNWWVPILVVGVIRLYRNRALFPSRLCRLVAVPAMLVGANFFLGFIEEKRAYSEGLPIFGLLAFQWVAIELGQAQRLVPRCGPSRPEAVEAGAAGGSRPRGHPIANETR